MSSQEAIVRVETAPRKHLEVHTSGARPTLAPQKAQELVGKKKGNFPKLKLGKPYSLMNAKGDVLGVVEIYERDYRARSVWVQYIDKRNHGRHQKLLYAHESKTWSDGMIALYADTPDAVGPALVLARRRIYHPAVETMRGVRTKMIRAIEARIEKALHPK